MSNLISKYELKLTTYIAPPHAHTTLATMNLTRQRKCLPTVVGGTCDVCLKDVCAQCSFFYAVRLCGVCAREHKPSLPPELHRMVDATTGGTQPPKKGV